MKTNNSIFSLLALASLLVYLFVSAPAPLTENNEMGKKLPIELVLSLCEYENDIVRRLYTKEIVGAGKKVGLKFDENWTDKSIPAGLLPAQFLRATAVSIEKSPVRLGLFLGSDFAINTANNLEAQQKNIFQEMKKDRKPRFFHADDTQLYAYMFPDVAVAKPCVKCHNEHPDSPKTDWVLNDVMGATTWTYPRESVNLETSLKILAALRKGFRDAYNTYLEKLKTLDNPPEIGEKWPRDGYFVPDVTVFMAKVAQHSSASTLTAFMDAVTVIKRSPKNKKG